MDAHALRVLEFDRIRELVSGECASEPGRAVARGQEPYTQLDTIRICLLQVDEARALLDDGTPLPVDGVVDVRRLIDLAHDGKRPFEPAEALDIGRTLRRARDLRDFVAARAERTPELEVLAMKFRDHASLLEVVDRTVEAPAAVCDGASEKLWEIRRGIRRIEDDVHARLLEILDRPRVRAAVQHGNYTIRNGRFVLAVKLDMKGRVPGILHDRSQTGSTAFIEPTEIVPFTNELRELRSEETKEENRVLWELTRAILDATHEIGHTANLLAWFDYTAAKARLSARFAMRAPQISPDGRLRLRQARHPLLIESVGEDVVPLDVRLREGFRILVITGPNTGRKTVTLKTVGLLQLMFQSGMHVPAEDGTTLPVFREVCADIGDEQSIAQNLSTFSGHIRNISDLLERGGKRTLVLLDELGAGTDPAEGAALGTAILEELRERGSACVVTTHLGSLKEYAFRHPEVENACVEFDPATLEPTYVLRIGQPGNSNALTIASRHGIPDHIVDAARKLVDSQGQPVKEVIDQLMESRKALEETRARSEQHLTRSRNLEKAAEEKTRHLEKRSRRVEREAEDLLDSTLRRVMDEAGPLLKELANAPKSLRPAVESLDELLRATFRDTSVGRKRREFIKGLKKQDEVFVPKFGQACRIRKFNRAEETLTVMVGNIAMEIGYDDVSWLPPAAHG